MTEFMTSAQTALVVVTELLSEQNFSELKGLLSSECLQEVEKNVRAMDTDQRKSLVVAEDDIFVAFPYRTKVHKGETEDKKQRIFFEVTVVFHVYKGYKDSTKQDAWAVFSNAKPELLTVYNCRFIREFTSEVEDQWTINAINLYKMNENPEYMYYRHNK
ncbi:hypothetical protein RUM43_003959 [Polyplax serrata]|uniref:Uncharacterized protein n=1 Tax=Polyplax serrata TaxID=468196 RepID=A0AAN8P397_POLSC